MERRENIILVDPYLELILGGLIPVRLQKSGHEIVGTAASLEEVRELSEGDLEENDVKLAIISGHQSTKVNGQEAAEILRKKFPEIKIVSVGFGEDSRGTWADEQVTSYDELVLSEV